MIIYQENCAYIIAVVYKSKYLIIVKIMENMDCFQNTYSDKQQTFWLEETIRLKYYTLRKKNIVYQLLDAMKDTQQSK